MVRQNFFELLNGLDFNEKNEQVIEEAIKKWVKEKNQLFSIETDLIEKNKIKEEMALESEMRKVMFNVELRKQEAQAMIEKRKSEIDNLARILSTDKEGPIPIMNARLRSISEKSGLKIQEVSKIFKNHHFDIKMKANTLDFNKYFLRDQMGEINKLLAEMNKPDVAKKYPWLTKKVNSLYDLLACYNNEPNMNYYNKKTGDLLSIATDGDKVYSIKQNVPEARTLFSKAKNDAFANDETRMRYDNSRKLMELDEFFAIAKNVPDSMKKDESFADVVIKRIQTKFPDYDLALTIYNQTLGLMRDPYEPEKALIHVYCGNCQSPATFQSVKEAMQAKCPVCGEMYYRKCPNCGKLIPTSIRKCTKCHFDLLEYQYFDSYYQNAKQAIQDSDIALAVEYYHKAQVADPKNNQLKSLDEQIKKLNQMYEKPLNQLQEYINKNEYNKANSYLSQIKSQYPKLNLKAQEKKIQDTLEKAKQMFNQKSNNMYEAANTCIRILRDVSDFIDAKEFVMQTAPRPVSHFMVTLENNGVQLSWHASPDIGVEYVILRKEDSPSKNINDGEQIFCSAGTLTYVDRKINPGSIYYYTAFVRRMSVLSQPVSQTITYTVDMGEDMLNFYLDKGKCIFTWTLPKNAIGVRVLKSKSGAVANQPGGNTQCVANNVYSSFEDGHLENGVLYQYRFQIIYQMKGKLIYTNGITKDIISEDIPDPVTIRQGQYNSTQQKIILDIKSNTPKPYKIQIIHLVGSFGLPNDIINTSELTKYGKIVAYGDSLDSKIQFAPLKNTGYKLGIATIAGSKAVLGNYVNISTFEKCEIDKQKTKVKNNRLNIHLKEPLAKNILKLYYACKIKDNLSSKPPYLTKDNLDEMKVISLESYERQHCIPIDALPENQLYITVIAELSQGNQSYFSEPSKLYINNSPKKKIYYEIQWKGTFTPRRKGAILRIDGENTECPTLYLVGTTDGKIPLDYTGKNVIVAKKIESQPSKSLSVLLDIPDSIPAKAKLRLFIDKEDQDEYELEVLNEKSLNVPTKK